MCVLFYSRRYVCVENAFIHTSEKAFGNARHHPQYNSRCRRAGCVDTTGTNECTTKFAIATYKGLERHA